MNSYAIIYVWDVYSLGLSPTRNALVVVDLGQVLIDGRDARLVLPALFFSKPATACIQFLIFLDLLTLFSLIDGRRRISTNFLSRKSVHGDIPPRLLQRLQNAHKIGYLSSRSSAFGTCFVLVAECLVLLRRDNTRLLRSFALLLFLFDCFRSLRLVGRFLLAK